jgi:hypothetical protein
MSDESAIKGLRERLASGTEDRLGKALTDLLENPLLGGALGRASDAREKASQAQELAMGALNLPSAADIERLTRRLRSVSQRLEGIEDGVHRLGRGFPGQSIDSRLGAIEEHLRTLSRTLGDMRDCGSREGKADPPQRAAATSKSAPAAPKRAKAKPKATAARKRAVGKATAAKGASSKAVSAKAASGKPARAKAASGKPARAKAGGSGGRGSAKA